MGKHEKTLAAIFQNPIRSNIKWRNVESLFVHHGAAISEGDGSRIHVELNGAWASFHRPHPRPDTNKGAIKSVREFLNLAGITP